MSDLSEYPPKLMKNELQGNIRLGADVDGYMLLVRRNRSMAIV